MSHACIMNVFRLITARHFEKWQSECRGLLVQLPPFISCRLQQGSRVQWWRLMDAPENLAEVGNGEAESIDAHALDSPPAACALGSAPSHPVANPVVSDAMVVHEDGLDAACHAASRSIDQLLWHGNAEMAKAVTLLGQSVGREGWQQPQVLFTSKARSESWPHGPH